MKNFKKSAQIAYTALAAIFLLALPVVIFAADPASQTPTSTKIIDGNVVRFGNNLVITEAINGDAILAGANITLNGAVAGDVIALGNNVKINGPVLGSVRVFANTLEITSEVGHNVWVAASLIILSKDTTVGWDVSVSGSQVEINGPVLGSVQIAAAKVTLNNEIAKNVKLSLDTGGTGILTPEAKIAGSLTYYASGEEQLERQTGSEVKGEVKKQGVLRERVGWPFRDRDFGAIYLLYKIVSLFCLLVVGLILMTLMPKVIFQVTEEMTRQPRQAMMRGFGYLAAVPVLVFFLLFTVIGLPLGLIILAIYFISLYLCEVMAAFTIGFLLVNQSKGSQKYGGSLLWPLVLGLLIFIFATDLPYLGWLIKLVLICWTWAR